MWKAGGLRLWEGQRAGIKAEMFSLGFPAPKGILLPGML